MKAIVKWGALLLAVSMLLSACGASPGAQTTAQPAAESAAAATEPVTTAKAEQETTKAETQTQTEAVELKGWKSDTSPVDLSLFINGSYFIVDMYGTDPASKRAQAQTGVTLKVTKPIADDNQKINIMIASDDIPDIIIDDRTYPTWGEMINNKQLADLDELIDQYAPDLRKNVGEDIFNISRINGKLYKINDYVEGDNFMALAKKYNGLVMSNQPVLLVRMDYFDEIGAPAIKTAGEFMDAVSKMVDNHPDHIGFYGGDGAFLSSIGPLRHHFGIAGWYEENGKLLYNFKNPKYLDALMWANQMATKGLLTKESYVDDSNVSRGKVSQGLTITYTWTLGEVGRVPGDNPDTTYQPLPPWDTYTQTRSGAGWMAVGIGAKSANQRRAIQFLDYCNSEDGMTALQYGTEGDEYSGDPAAGPNWHMVDGKPTFLQDYYTEKLADWDGISRKNGLGEYGTLQFDSGPINLPAWIPGDTFMESMNDQFGDMVKYRPDLDILIPAGTDEDVIKQKIADLLKDYMVKIIFEKDADAARALYDEFIDSVNQAGANKVEEYATSQWNH